MPAAHAQAGEVALEGAGPVLTLLAVERGYSRDFLRFRQLIEKVLGRDVDLVSYGGLKPGLDDDVRRDAVPV